MTDPAVLDKALQVLENRRTQSERDLELRKKLIYAKIPRLQEIDRQLASTGISVARAVLSQSDKTEELLQKLRETNLSLQEERNQLLCEAGLSSADLTPHRSCLLCNDQGYVNGHMCDCLRNLIRSLSYQRLCQDFPMDEMTFSTFSLDRYSEEEERIRMEQIFQFCSAYAKDFSPSYAYSLYFFGGTGLGKTHLSLAIAGAVTEMGYHVVYGSWQGFLSRMEEQKFSPGQSMEETHSALTSCDLLILDDLGSEFITSFDISCLYHILNTRINRGLPTIISSNLPPEQLVSNYNERIASRIRGCFELFPFQGHDQRISI